MCLALLPTQGWGAIAVDQRAIGTAIAGGTTQTTSFTVNAASPLVVACTADVNTSGVTWNGTSMDVLRASLVDGAGTSRTALFGLKSPATGTHDVVATFASAVGGANCAMVSTTGGDTTTSWRTVYTRVGDTDGTGPGTTVVDSQNGDLVVHAAHVFASTITFDGGEDTTSTEDDAIAGGGISMGLSTKAATGASTAVGATDATYYAEIAVAIIPASAEAAFVPSLMLMGVGQ